MYFMFQMQNLLIQTKRKKHSDNKNDSNHDKRMKDYYKDMTPEQIAEKKKQFKEMGEAWEIIVNSRQSRNDYAFYANEIAMGYNV